MAIIDILIIADAEAMLGSATQFPIGSAEQPVKVADKLVYLVVKQEDAVFGNASGELKITVETEDVIRWRETSLSLNVENYALMYDFKLLKGADLLTPLIPIVAEVKTPLPDRQHPTQPKQQTIQDYFWESTVLAAGESTYLFRFMIVDRHGTVKGYYYWDPFISIKD